MKLNFNVKKFKGLWTALVTSFLKENGEIDWLSFNELVRLQLQAGVSGILIAGTTGESPTLKRKEPLWMVNHAKKIVGDNCLIMAGTGTYDTAESIERTKMVRDAGADAVLLVTPYYSKPTQEGMYRHFKTIAESTDLPVLIYNITGRTGVNLEINTFVRLVSNVENIVGVKEASGNLRQIETFCDIKKSADDIVILSGDDNITFQTMKDYGVDGVISVASNIVPKEMVEMVNHLLNGNFPEAEEINTRLSRLFGALFVETNPIPVKYALSLMKLCQEVYRSPMCELAQPNAKRVENILRSMKIIE